MSGLAGLAILGKVKSIASAIPWWVWAVLGFIALLWLGSCVHSSKVKSHDKAIIAANDKRWNDKLDKAHLEALSYKNQVEVKQREINRLIGERNETTRNANAELANAARLSGPGAARCRSRDNPTVSGNANNSPRTSEANASRSTMPTTDFVAVPWGWLVTRAQEHDDCEADLAAVWEWHKQQSEVNGLPNQ